MKLIVPSFSDRAVMSSEEIKTLQTRLLNQHIAYCRENSSYYRRLNLPKGEITLEDLALLPTTDKFAFAENNLDFLAVDNSRIADICLTSGTTGKPCQMIYTKQDLDRAAINDAIGFAATGVDANDIVLLTCTIDRCFVAGLAYYNACVKLGATAIRNGLSSIQSHVQLIEELKPTTIVGVPSFLAKLGEYMEKKSSSVKRLICIGEALRTTTGELTAIAQKLNSYWPNSLFSTYASSEIFTSFTECQTQCGGHAPSELAIVEILDDNGNVLPAGEVGEVTVTPLQVEGMPLIRFRTGDIGFIHPSDCPCGNKAPRLGPILGRKAQMLKIHGTTLFPQAIFNVLDAHKEVKEYFVTVENSGLSDALSITVAGEGDLDLELLGEQLFVQMRMRAVLNSESLELVRNKVFGAGRKPTRFFDFRKKLY